MEYWIGKTAIVTGASSSIGAAVTKNLLEIGINVIGVARNVRKLKEIKEQTEHLQGEFSYSLLDVTNDDDVKRVLEYVQAIVDTVSILVNCAGVTRFATLHDGETQLWKEVLDTNVLGVCNMTREVIKIMRKKNLRGHIINMNSKAGHKVVDHDHTNVFCASKFAVTALAETIRLELKDLNLKNKIKVTNISPGRVQVNNLDSLQTGKDINEVIGENPPMSAEDVANTVNYVLSTPPHVEVTELIVTVVGEEF